MNIEVTILSLSRGGTAPVDEAAGDEPVTVDLVHDDLSLGDPNLLTPCGDVTEPAGDVPAESLVSLPLGESEVQSVPHL